MMNHANDIQKSGSEYFNHRASFVDLSQPLVKTLS
jgi:hypothetical protein